MSSTCPVRVYREQFPLWLYLSQNFWDAGKNAHPFANDGRILTLATDQNGCSRTAHCQDLFKYLLQQCHFRLCLLCLKKKHLNSNEDSAEHTDVGINPVETKKRKYQLALNAWRHNGSWLKIVFGKPDMYMYVGVAGHGKIHHSGELNRLGSNESESFGFCPGGREGEFGLCPLITFVFAWD